MNPINTTVCFTLKNSNTENEEECQWELTLFCAVNQEIFAQSLSWNTNCLHSFEGTSLR